MRSTPPVDIITTNKPGVEMELDVHGLCIYRVGSATYIQSRRTLDWMIPKQNGAASSTANPVYDPFWASRPASFGWQVTYCPGVLLPRHKAAIPSVPNSEMADD